MTEPETRPGKPGEELGFPPALEDFVANLPEIQLMSVGAMDLLRELNREDISGRRISSKIGRDPTLSARILRLANSSYFGTRNRIATVNQAVTMLGVDNVRKLVQGICMVELSTPGGGLAKVFGGKAFAAHAIAVSYLSGAITRKFGFQMLGRGEAETAGLLHDIGMCFLGSGDLSKYKKVQVEFWNRMGDYIQSPEGQSLDQVELEVLGFTHAHLGGWLATKWNLPLNIREALMWHHESPAQSVNKEIVAVVQLAEVLCNEHELDFLPIGACSSIHPDVIQFLESQGKGHYLESLSEVLAQDLEKARELYRLILTDGKVPVGDLEDRVLEKRKVAPKISEERVRPKTSLPLPVFLLVGLPQIMRGEKGKGAFYMGAFFLSLVLFLFVAVSGTSPLVGGAFLLVSAACWVLSILQA